KYASPNSGDTVEVVERPQGGYSVVLVDGQSSGRGAKTSSVLVVRKVIGLLADGVRDGAAARAASDNLYAERGGKVSATLNIISADLHSRTLLITRNNPNPAYLARGDELRVLNEESRPIGLYRDTRPVITEVDLVAGMTIVAFTDGIVHAGSRTGDRLDVAEVLQDLLDAEEPSAQYLADSLLDHALRLDQGRPVDDISVIVMRVLSRTGDEVRRMSVRLPVEF
ncbi:MAG TPA: PP2C family protein-serine/threonine phosphatase, partial [Anaerolineales bacterium]|nr:PP2C family protein-serine/threonine phosphatase [Anaerolineales bacterium]